jgi:hypothetical protein
MVIRTLAVVISWATAQALAAPGLSVADYDENLCVTAQRIVVNDPDIPVSVQRGRGDGFHSIQMSIDENRRTLIVAMESISLGAGETGAAWVACKMVNRDRVNDVLEFSLSGPPRSCRDVNAHTHQVALNQLTVAQRERYLRDGRVLEFRPDTIVPTGGEWLPARAEDYVSAEEGGISVSAPSVRVPWNSKERGFFQGTQHCKLLTLSTMQAWMTDGAFDRGGELLASAAADCTAPAQAPVPAGSCLFYFAPANAMFCQDYNGAGWDAASARAACAKRHASREALAAADNRYEGSGGVFSAAGCAQRNDAPPIIGTCVFNCGRPDESLWQVSEAAGGMGPMSRACDLYLPKLATDY